MSGPPCEAYKIHIHVAMSLQKYVWTCVQVVHLSLMLAPTMSYHSPHTICTVPQSHERVPAFEKVSTAYFWPNLVYRVYSNEYPLWSEHRVTNKAHPWTFESTAPSTMDSEERKLCIIFHWRLLQVGLLSIDRMLLMWSWSTMLMVTWCHSECCVLSGLDFQAVYPNICFEGINMTWEFFRG